MDFLCQYSISTQLLYYISMVFTSSNSKIIRMYLKTFCDSDLPTKGFKTQRADSASIGLCLPKR